MDTLTCTDTACTCGKPSVHTNGQCRACYMRSWRKARKVAGSPLRSPCAADWFDWEVVERAWAGKPVGRKLTRSEREYLAKLLVRDPHWTALAASKLLGMEPGPAERVALGVATGRVKVPARGVYGEAL